MIKHGQSRTRLYNIWKQMKARCSNPNNPNFDRYGLRGITVCEGWQNFVPFWAWSEANGYAEDLTLDRIKGDGDYCPENCRWTTAAEQSRNCVSNKLDAESVAHLKWFTENAQNSLADIAIAFGISYGHLRNIQYSERWGDIEPKQPGFDLGPTAKLLHRDLLGIYFSIKHRVFKRYV